MPITIDEIREAVGTQPELKVGVMGLLKEDFQKGLESEGVIIRTKEQEEAYLRSYEDKVLPGKVDAKFSEKFKASLDEIDSSVTDLTGEKKGPHEKTTDFLKRGLTALKGRGGDPVTKEKVAQLEKMLSEKENEWSTKYNEVVSRAEKKEIDIDVSIGLADKSFPLPAHLKTDEEKQRYTDGQKKFIKNDFLSSFTAKRDSEGNTVYYEGDQPKMNTKDGKPLTAKEIIEEKYSPYFLQATRTVTGTGQGANGVVVTPGNFKTTDDIHKYLAAKGMQAGTKEYGEELEKLAKEASIRI
jgi:hypothetical protein